METGTKPPPPAARGNGSHVREAVAPSSPCPLPRRRCCRVPGSACGSAARQCPPTSPWCRWRRRAGSGTRRSEMRGDRRRRRTTETGAAVREGSGVAAGARCGQRRVSASGAATLPGGRAGRGSPGGPRAGCWGGYVSFP